MKGIAENSKAKTFGVRLFYAIWYFTLDKIGSIFLLLCCFPLLLATALCIYLEDGRPIFFRQWRAGKDGKPFKIFKFRSMRKGAEKDPRSQFVDEKNPFLTRVGRFIREWSIDELPQLFNVLMGQMSLVGPRPLPFYEIQRYGVFQRKRVLTKPGITGLAQIMGRNELPWSERLRYDVWYVEHKSPLLDLYILFRTPGVVLEKKGVYEAGVNDVSKI